jgi:hypothetical protein
VLPDFLGMILMRLNPFCITEDTSLIGNVKLPSNIGQGL